MEEQMKKSMLLVAAVLLICTLLQADIMPPGTLKPTLESSQGIIMPRTREVPAYTFTRTPQSIIVNYYDYMIGSYSSLPLRVIPSSAGGGYFMTYHGRRQPTSTRRVFYTYMDASGNVISNNEIISVQNHEGFPSMVIDPVSGKPLYAWHANADADANLEVQFVSDAFMEGFSGLWNDIQLTADAPTTITAPNGTITTDNEFIWPTATIGPSPIAGKRRIYISQRNYVSHAVNASPSENVYIAYADFDGDMIEQGIPLVWNHTTLPEYDAWNVDTVQFRRPSSSIAADEAGNIYYIGYHVAMDADSNGLNEPDLDVFICPNYGEGTWSRVTRSSNLPVYNPPATPGGTAGYYTDPDNGEIPYTNDQLFFQAANSSHINAVVDRHGRVHALALWALSTYNDYYYPALQFVKQMVYDPGTQQIQVKDLYPQKDPEDTFNQTFMPWDIEAPWGEVDEYGGDATSGYYPLMVTDWPFPHWDQTAHTDAMMFHYNGVRISPANDQGMMVAVWQNAERARMFNYYSDTDYAQFANTPEIYIAVSPNNGNDWSEPIILNNVETPEFSGLKPMYVYPADQVIYTGMQGTSKVGKIGLMFYDDYTWGSNVNAPAYHPTPDGGQVMFTEMQIVFPPFTDNDDPISAPAVQLLHPNFPNPFNPSTTINFDMPKAGNARLSVYNVKGQLVRSLVNEDRGFGSHSVVWNGMDDNGNTVPSGIYFYRLSTDNHTETRKMMLMK